MNFTGFTSMNCIKLSKRRRKKIHNFFKAFLLVLIISFAFIFCCWWFFFSFHSWITKTANCIIDGLAKWKEEEKKNTSDKKNFSSHGCWEWLFYNAACIHIMYPLTGGLHHEYKAWLDSMKQFDCTKWEWKKNNNEHMNGI